jgi:hypothetical protein
MNIMYKRVAAFIVGMVLINLLLGQDNGLTALRDFDKLPQLRTDIISGQQSSHDPTGGNQDGFSSGNFPGTYKGENLMIHLKGKGVINRIWLTGYQPFDKIKIYFDGENTARVDETIASFFSNSTAPFLNPWVVDASISSGGFISYLPFHFEKSIIITTTGNSFYNINYQMFGNDNLSVISWRGDEDLSYETQVISNQGTDSRGNYYFESMSNTFDLQSGKSKKVFELNKNNKVATALFFTFPEMEFFKIGENVLTDNGRATTGYSEFTMKIDPAASKVVLSRRFDSWVANQKANVYIDGVLVGEWFERVFDPIFQWRNAYFDIPQSFTSGKSQIRIKVEFVSSNLDWNEFYYWIYCDGVVTDEIDVGNLQSEYAHNYIITPLNWSGSLSSQYPVTLTDRGRAHKGYSTFKMNICPEAEEYKLIRRSDYGIGNQKSKVYIDDIEAGIWDNAGINVNNRWADKEFIIPSDMIAKGKPSIHVKIEFIDSDIDWNEFYYWMLCDGMITDELDVNNSISEAANHYEIYNETWAGEATYQYGREMYKPELSTQNINLQIFYDGEETPSVDAPLGLFFATSTIQNTEFQSLPVGVLPETKTFYSYFPMPFKHSISVKLVNNSFQSFAGIEAVLRFKDCEGDFLETGYFKTQYNRGFTDFSRDYVLLSTTGAGKYVGTILEVKNADGNLWLEGDERFYLDGLRTPSFYGTGTEDYFNGGWYFNMGPFQLPFHGHTAFNGSDRCLYRFHITDALFFNEEVLLGIEHGPNNDVKADYHSIAFFYHKPAVWSMLTDELDIGDIASMHAHDYKVNGVFEIKASQTFQFEGDLDDQDITESGYYIKGSSEFKVTIDPQKPVRIKRLFDYGLSDQLADVFVDDVYAGTWFTNGSNSFKRWREEFFNIPHSLTIGKSSLILKFKASEDSFNWSEFNYQIFALGPETSVSTQNVDCKYHEISIFPNPAKDYLFINSGNQKFQQVSVYNTQGKLILLRNNVADRLSISELPAGIYILVLQNNQETINQKFIKQ